MTGRLVPDFGLYRGSDHVGWVELKAPDKDLDGPRAAFRFLELPGKVWRH
jgi:hypothetical protein